jgi:hypothetical protein
MDRIRMKIDLESLLGELGVLAFLARIRSHFVCSEYCTNAVWMRFHRGDIPVSNV